MLWQKTDPNLFLQKGKATWFTRQAELTDDAPNVQKRTFELSASSSVTRDPCQLSAKMAYFLQHFHCRKVAPANITPFRQAKRLTGKRMKVAAQQKGSILYKHYQVHEVKSHPHKVKEPPKDIICVLLAFFCHSEMSIISLLARSSWQSLTAAVNALKCMRFLYSLQERCQKSK